MYTARNYWRQTFLSVIDVLRVVEDIGKYYFQNRVLRRSFNGVRGSFLLTSGKLENDVGWDTACLAEDYEFAWRVRSLQRL